MKVLVVGSGGREHALVWKVSQSPKVDKIYCAPGNGGIAQLAECIPIGAEEIDRLLDFAKENKIDLTIAGPEGPLTMGIVDRFEQEGLKIFGPRENAAILEGSKIFTKEFLEKHNIPSAEYRSFQEPSEAMDYIREKGAPIVVKADGLAAGKGVIVAQSVDEALAAVTMIMEDKTFGAAGESIVVEECLVGEEASFMVFTDGKTVVPMLSSQDHKQVLDGDKGPNTGGMGAYTPAPVIQDRTEEIMESIMIPTIRGMEADGRPFKGVLYAGLMITDKGIQILEFNVRFGDPEAQPILFRLETDLIEIIDAINDGRLDQVDIQWKDGASVCVVLASDGYPGIYEKGKILFGLDMIPSSEEIFVFHAGTRIVDDKLVTSGGRVLGITSYGEDLSSALEKAYAVTKIVDFKGNHFRSDIGRKGLVRNERDKRSFQR